jgi:dCMP deaminase
MKQKFIDAYMDTAKRFAELSTAVKLKVGAIVVKDDRIVSIGYNGTPAGWSNDCEYAVLDGPDKPLLDEHGVPVLKTKPEVLHAEANALTKLAKSTESGEGATLFCTHSPCIHCAKLIAQSGIKEVYYDTEYRSDEGLKFLEKFGVIVKKL